MWPRSLRQNLFLYGKMWRAECMSEVLYRGYFSDDYELMCNWQWDTRDDTLEISVWNYNMDTMGSIYTTPAL